MNERRDIVLVCGGKFHDIDFARLELLKLLAEHDHFRVQLLADYADAEAIRAADALVTYTCELVPDQAGQDALADFLASGKRWFALHGTNSSLEYRKGEGWAATDAAPRFMEMLGSQFVAHPPIQPFTVEQTTDHPLVAGIDAFEADDEIYLCRFFGEHDCLLHTHYSGMAEGFVEDDWRDNSTVPVMYRREWGGGEILYLNLGHARGHYDMQPMMETYPQVERGSWKQPAFYELLRRGLRWMVRDELEAAA